MEKLIDTFTTIPFIFLGSALFLAIFYWQRFNTWTPKEISDFNDAKLSPPRHFTKWSSFLMYAAIYVLIVEIAYLLLIWLFQTPVLLEKFHTFFGIGDINAIDEGSIAYIYNSILMSLWILTGVVPIFPGLNRAEPHLRETLHEKALIPEEANSVVDDLQIHESRFHPTANDVATALTTQFLQRYGKFYPEDSRPSATVRHKWFKLIYLYYKLREWTEGMRAMRRASPAYKTFEHELEKANLDVQEYFMQVESSQGEPRDRRQDLYLRRLELDIDAKLSEMLASIYRFISCAIYATEILPQGTMQAFSRFGLNPRLEIHVPFDWDTLMESGVAVLLSTLFPTLIYFFAFTDRFPDSDLLPGSTLYALAWTMTAVLAHGMAIIAALFVFRFATRQPKYGFRSHELLKPSAARVFLIGCAGYVVGLLTFTVYSGLDPKEALDKVEISVWALLPATTAAFIGYHLDHYIYAANPGYSRLNGALLQGILTMLVCVLIVALLYSRYSNTPELPYFLTFAALVAALIGAGIGYTFPEGYKRTLRGYAGKNRRQTRRLSFKNTPLSVQLAFGDDNYSAQLLDISKYGAALESPKAPNPNAAAELSVPDLGKLKGVLARQDKDRSFFRFFPDQPAVDQVRSYIATRAMPTGMQIQI